MDSKYCKRCNQILCIEEFTPCTRYKSGYASNCKKCVMERNKINYEKNKDVYNKRTQERYYEKLKLTNHEKFLLSEIRKSRRMQLKNLNMDEIDYDDYEV
jgi:hypothetical protein